MEIIYSKRATLDLDYYKRTGNRPVYNKIKQLVEALKKSPFTGIGKPEPLKHQLSGLWSRRINKEHRLIYEVANSSIRIHSLRGHY